jgi:hypothetical protein
VAEAIGVGEVMLARSAASATVVATVHRFDPLRGGLRVTATLPGMGRQGQKRRRPGRPAHLPKVGTATENQREQRGERDAVLGNFGVAGLPSWVTLTIGVIAVVVVIGAVVTLVALN